MAGLRVLVLGDDFTPAHLFRDAIQRRLGDDAKDLHVLCRDTEANDLSRFRSDEVAEAFGDDQEVVRLAKDCDLLVTTFAPVTEQVFEAAPDLLAVACGRGGPINVNTDAATRRGIPVLYAPGRNVQAVADLVNELRRFEWVALPPAMEQSLREADKQRLMMVCVRSVALLHGLVAPQRALHRLRRKQKRQRHVERKRAALACGGGCGEVEAGPGQPAAAVPTV